MVHTNLKGFVHTFDMVKEINQYIKDILEKILNSYSIIENLESTPKDLEILQLELKKINGFLLVLNKKLAENNAKLSDYKKLNKKISYYFHNYDFAREIQLLLNTYSEDELRVRNIKNSVVNSLKHKKLIDEIYEFYKST